MNGELHTRHPAVRRWFFGVASLLGVAFALVSEPDEPGVASWLSHLVQWQLQTLIPMLLLLTIQMAVLRLPVWLRGGQWGALLWTGGMSALLFTPVALAVDIWLAGEGDFTLGGLAGEFLAMGPPVLICWLAINAPFVLGFRVLDPERPAAEETRATQPAFFTELPEGVAGDLIYLKAELHYINVVTTQGRALILYNLRDAIAVLPEGSGLQTHRGYWVARQHVVSFRKSGRQGEITLSNGDNVPVSRARLAAVREAIDGLTAR